MTLRLLSLTLLLVALVGAACGGDDESAAPAARSAGTEAVREVERGAAALLDVRTRAEYGDRHAVAAEHIPLDDIEQGERPAVAKDARLYVYCATGRRAGIAAEILRRDGWKDVVNVGGLDDWERMGGAVEPS
jgi:rhodanese-related sulfurtransferase